MPRPAATTPKSRSLEVSRGVVAEIVRAAGADTTDFIDMAVEAFRRDTNLEGAVLVAGGVTYEQSP